MLCHIHWTDPSNLALASLLRSGALDEICRRARRGPARLACALAMPRHALHTALACLPASLPARLPACLR